jgi:hypothetical protein
VDAFEEQVRQIFPAWHAMDLRLMFEGYQDRGFEAQSAVGSGKFFHEVNHLFP